MKILECNKHLKMWFYVLTPRFPLNFMVIFYVERGLKIQFPNHTIFTFSLKNCIQIIWKSKIYVFGLISFNQKIFRQQFLGSKSSLQSEISITLKTKNQISSIAFERTQKTTIFYYQLKFSNCSENPLHKRETKS